VGVGKADKETLMDRTVTRIETAAPPQRGAPTHANRMVVAPEDFERHSPFLMMAEDWFAPPAGFPTHPHRGMETVTVVLEGSLEHRDHTGGHGVLSEGDVQWMTAGKGVLHSEMPGPGGVHSLQLWLNLPAARKMTAARYLDQRSQDAEVVVGQGWEVRVYAGRQGDAVRPHGSSYGMGLVRLKAEAGARLSLEIPADERAFLYIIEGAAKVGPTRLQVTAGKIAWLDPTGPQDAAPDTLALETDAGLQAVLFTGRPIAEPVVAYGPFVMNTQDEIRQAFEDYRRGEFV
jgi:redox-sensitive bicupin YhaK (pirin superfamily)